MRRSCAVLLLTNLFALAGCSTELGARAPTPGLGALDDSLVGGSYTYERPEVGSIAGCTATLIGPRLVVTAAHCVDYGTRRTPGSYGSFEVRRAAGESRRFTIERYTSFGGTVGDDDVALLRLATAVPPEVATPAGLARVDPPSSTSVTIYGYGCQRRGTSGTWAKQRVRVGWGRLSTNLCPGDSGGPTITDEGLVVRINSGYWLDDTGGDIFGRIPVVLTRLERQAAEWGDTLGSGTPAPTPPDGGAVPSDAGSMTRDAGAPPPPPPPGSGPCDRPTCGEATALAGCGWCDATGRGLRVGAYGESLEPCASGFRLDPADCDAAPRSTCGPWTGVTEYACRRGRTQFVRCTEGGVPEFLTCPSGYTCVAGSTERYCYR